MKKNLWLGRTLPSFLFLLVFFWGTGLNEISAQAQASLQLSSVEVKRGETIQLPVTLTSAGEIRALQFDLQYDREQLTFTQSTNGTLTENFFVESNPNNGRVLIASMDRNIPAGTGTIATLTFQLNANFTGDRANLQLTRVSASDGTGEEALVNLTNDGLASISLTAATTPPVSGGTPAGGGGGGGGGGAAPTPAPAPTTTPAPIPSGAANLATSFQQKLNQATSASGVAGQLQKEKLLKQTGESLLAQASKEKVADEQVVSKDGVTTATIDEQTVNRAFAKMNVKRAELQGLLQSQKTNVRLERPIELQIPKEKQAGTLELNIPTATQNQLQLHQVDYVLVDVESKATLRIPVSTMTGTAGRDWKVTLSPAQVESKPQGHVDLPVWKLSSTQPLEVQFDVSSLIKDGKQAERLAVVQWANQQWKPMAGQKLADGKIRIAVKSDAPFTMQEIATGYQDLGPVASWAKNPIEVMAGHGLIDARNASTFDPMTPITRAEYVQLIVRTLGLEAGEGTKAFTDVKPTHPYYREIHTASQLGIVSGVGANQFSPDKSITREEMASIIARTLSATDQARLQPMTSGTLNGFKDQHAISGWAKEAVAATVQMQWMKGVKADEFKPKDKATRAQATVMMYQLWSQN